MLEGVLGAAAVIAGGLIWYLSAHLGESPGDHLFNGEPKYFESIGGMLRRALELKEIGHRRIELQNRQRLRAARQLQARLIEMIQVKMRVAKRVNEIAGHAARYLRNHVGQKRITRNVERDAQKHVGRALIKLT